MVHARGLKTLCHFIGYKDRTNNNCEPCESQLCQNGYQWMEDRSKIDLIISKDQGQGQLRMEMWTERRVTLVYRSFGP